MGSEAVRREVRIACYDWAAGILVGLMPLLAHVLISFAGRPEQGWNANWAPDILFICISNSGMAALTVFIKMLAGGRNPATFAPLTRLVWVLLLLCFALASMLYGVDVSGADNGNSWKVAAVLVVLSGICSLNFEIAMAREKINDSPSS